MKSVGCCFLFLAAGLWAQSTAKLDADLTALANPGASRNAITQQVADDILALAEKDAQPSRQSVVDFADALTRARLFFLSFHGEGAHVIGLPTFDPRLQAAMQAALLARLQSREEPTLQTVTQAVLDVLQSSGVSSSRFHDAIDRFYIELGATRAAKSAADRLLILGQEVRGPEDMKVGVR